MTARPHEPFVPTGVRALISHRALQQPQASAILAPGRPLLSYAGLDALVGRVGEDLRGLGVHSSDRIAVIIPNGPEMATAFLSVASTATCAPLNPAYRRAEYEFFLSDLNAKLLLIPEGFPSDARRVAEDLGVGVVELHIDPNEPAGVFSLETDVDEGVRSVDVGDGNVALVLHTSGTTSRPKIVPLTHSNICTSAAQIAASLELGPNDRCLNVMPLFHIHGLLGATLSSVSVGASVVCTSGFDSARFCEWLEGFSPTWYTAAPTIHHAVLEAARKHPEIVKRRPLRLIRSSSASLPPNLMTELEEAFSAPVIESYGMTEAAHQMTSNPLPPAVRKPGSVGVAAGPEVAIMGGGGVLLGRGETGDIVIRGPSVMAAYDADPAVNQEAFIDGWFRTGDEGSFDEDGYLTISGRTKEMINRGGEKVIPREIDEALLQHPDVAQAVAFSVAHPTLGEDVAAAVVLTSPGAASTVELREFAFERLADFKVPSIIVLVDEIPKGPTGKLQRIGLADKLKTQLEVAYVPPRTDDQKAMAAIWARALGVERVGLDDNFFALGGDSLSAAHLFSLLADSGYDARPLGTLFRSPTVAELTESFNEDTSEMSSSLVPIAPSGSLEPIFFVHGHGGSVVGFRDLAEALGPEQPFYAFEAPEDSPDLDVGDLAARYVAELRSIEKTGPYHLGGWCLGGSIAIEMARLLRSDGEEVAPVLMVQSTHPDFDRYRDAVGTPRKMLRRMLDRLDMERRFVSERPTSGGRTRISATLERSFGWATVAVERAADALLGRHRSRIRHTRAFEQRQVELDRRRSYSTYRHEPFDGDVVILRVNNQPRGVPDDPTLGWGSHVRGHVKSVEIPGHQLGMLTAPRVELLADALRHEFDSRTAANSGD